MRVSAHLDLDLIPLDTQDQVTVLLEITAPRAATTTRPPATLQIVLDRSGSMAGDRLDGAKQALLALVDRLDPTDNFGVVTFESSARVEVAAGPLADKRAVRRAIAAIGPAGSTDLSSGLLRGVQETRRASADRGATLLLISDGHANAGIVDHDLLGEIAGNAYGNGVVTTTLGYGLGYDEHLLATVADRGTGSALFAEDPDTATRLIAAEADNLLAKVAQAASMTIHPREPVREVHIFGHLPSNRLADGSLMVDLGDFHAGETRRLLLRFAVPGMPSLGPVSVAELSFTHVEIPSLTTHTVTVQVVVDVVPGDRAADRIAAPEVRTELAFQQAQEARRAADDALRRGETEEAAEILRAAGDVLEAHLPSAVPSMVKDLAEEVNDLRDLAERARWDDVRRTSKGNMERWHRSTRKRRRHEDDAG
ncbi:VWA domain-containing protein [Streptosporangium carneum]|uniref:VWFA domain-containing protein n=1 Tax=Streptosporangium carneum TaxID=47481 RepID=A0A9W6I7Q7_9ACTN|nr:VWA domain-containing protein [Streptosporangium carneum]GLK13267.1 hypothetical protein GCM10017600_66780 [Streptosporangium carneum]